MANEKLQISIPVSSMKNATQRRTRRFLCCSCFGPKESMSDSAITITLSKYDESEYVVEKLSIKRIPPRLLTNEEITPDKIEPNPSDSDATTIQSSQFEALENPSEKRPTGITFSSYYKMVPNKSSPGKIPQMRERTESSIITLSDTKNQTTQCYDFNTECEGSVMNKYKTFFANNFGSEKDFANYNNNMKYSMDSEDDRRHERDGNDTYLQSVERHVANIDPQTKKTLQILGGASAGENIHRYYHHFAKGPVRDFGHPGIANEHRDVEECPQEPVCINMKNKCDINETTTSSAPIARQGLKWKILIKHHNKSKRNQYIPAIESTTEGCTDSEY